MDESSLCKTLTFSQLEGSRKKGRPKLRWLDDVLEDLKILEETACGGMMWLDDSL
jgi:hypothetical protein